MSRKADETKAHYIVDMLMIGASLIIPAALAVYVSIFGIWVW